MGASESDVLKGKLARDSEEAHGRDLWRRVDPSRWRLWRIWNLRRKICCTMCPSKQLANSGGEWLGHQKLWAMHGSG